MWADLERVAVDEGLRNICVQRVNVLNLLRRNVLALRAASHITAHATIVPISHQTRGRACLGQLEDVFRAVDDLDGAVGRPLADVAAVQPA